MFPPYRPITELTDEEITYIINELLAPQSITEINRTTILNEPSIEVTYMSLYGDEHETFEAPESVTLQDPFDNNGEGITSNDDTIFWETQIEFQKYCLAKGVCILLKKNRYLPR